MEISLSLALVNPSLFKVLLLYTGVPISCYWFLPWKKKTFGFVVSWSFQGVHRKRPAAWNRLKDKKYSRCQTCRKDLNNYWTSLKIWVRLKKYIIKGPFSICLSIFTKINQERFVLRNISPWAFLSTDWKSFCNSKFTFNEKICLQGKELSLYQLGWNSTWTQWWSQFGWINFLRETS